MISIIRREINEYKKNTLLLIAAGVIMLYSGLRFWGTLYSREINNVTQVYSNNTFILLLFIPLLTMSSFAKEKADGTDRILFSSSMPMNRVAIGKFLAAFLVFMLFSFVSMIIPSILMVFYGRYWIEVVFLLIGLFMLGSIVCSFGIFLSSLSTHEYRAFLVTVAGLFVWWMMDTLMPYVGNAFVKAVFYVVSIFSRYKIFEYGVLSFSTLIYFVSITAVFLMMSIQSLLIWRQRR
ncbi:MAG: hypothetical protein IKI62_07360 [Clostridia bacterium]|nr:hypothetical protein [Clostridia bacterium]